MLWNDLLAATFDTAGPLLTDPPDDPPPGGGKQGIDGEAEDTAPPTAPAG